ncbi:BTB/POZ domain-containing protein At2g13690 [Diospyros lotus]|uniref:BTB/POZ domain-containing protein At2g13690 n=1 Tax=Diospyros lotus TaxID=55363 RepID=UPI0022556E62|nr:BTB/POZ domain-containing protein At2g13690 [Diospyros lotus]
MQNSIHNKPRRRRDPPPRRRSWCCSFAVPPRSPDNPFFSHPKPPPPQTLLKSAPSFPNSPQTRLGLVGRIDRRRILSPGRVSPIDSDPTSDPVPEIPVSEPSPAANANGFWTLERSEKSRGPEGSESSSDDAREDGGLGIFDVRLSLKGKNGGCLVLELNSEVLSANSMIFAKLIADCRKGSSGSAANLCRIEVPEVENLNVFRETIELMFEEDITKRLLKMGVYRSIDMLEVSAGIMFTKGVMSCLKYLEAVPWSEEEEEKLRNLFNRFKFDEETTQDILARLYPLDSVDSQQILAKRLVWSITSCTDTNARNELKSLVKGLLCKSSIYEKNYPDINKGDLYAVCQSCLGSLVRLFEEASTSNSSRKFVKQETDKPLVERISKQVDNINWLMELLLDKQMAEDFVDLWADQGELLKMHEKASPMVRYELSRVSAMLFIALGTRKLQCKSETRLALLQAWFNPMLLDFGWLQRCRKGLDVRALEEAMGQALLTLPLKQQYGLFMEWFRCFSKQGAECPNLSKAFQVWWRRSFLRGSETYAVESR